jgi:hypothetical protein
MDFDYKLSRFATLMKRNERTQKKAIHISLNFHPSEKEKLNKDLLIEITDEYMKRIGFERQPYLVYQHHDTVHPHVHIVSTLIRTDGRRIHTHNIGRNQSAKARKELEQIYGLVSPNKRILQKVQEQKVEQKQGHVQKLKYGKAETKRGIANVLEMVVNQFKYTSLQELNAVLRQYNVLADRGREEGRMYKNRGLVYRVLDENGRKIGAPVKASSFEGKPTIVNLEKKFLENALKREPEKKRLRNAIDWTLVKPKKSLREFVQTLEMERVAATVMHDREGRAYGFTYVDHQTRSVFNEINLGKEYSAARILERLGLDHVKEKALELENERVISKTKQQERFESDIVNDRSPNLERKNEHVLAHALELLIKPEETNEQQVYKLTKESKREKNKEYEPER